MQKALLVLLVVLLIVFSGCASKPDAIGFAKTISTVKSFLAQNPDAKENSFFIGKEAAAENIDLLRNQCGNSMSVANYYFVVFEKDSNKLELYLDETAKQLVCIVKEKQSTTDTNVIQKKPCEKITCQQGEKCVAGKCVKKTCTELGNCETKNCSSYRYGVWSNCNNSGTKTRTLLASFPTGCVNPKPILAQSCNVVPTCTEADWSASLSPTSCPNNGKQSRTWIKIGNCNSGITHENIETIDCNYLAPTCTSFSYSDWNSCSSSGTQSRKITAHSPDGCDSGNPITTQECDFIPACVEEDWTSNISPVDCPASEQQSKTWTKIGNCSAGISHPETETVSCDYQTPSCNSFSYSDWSACNVSGTQARDILASLPDGCAGGNPITSQACNYVPTCKERDWNSSLNPIVCPATGKQSKNWTKIGNCFGGITHPATETIDCNYLAPTCTSFSYSDWSVCTKSGIQTRQVTGSNPEGCVGGNPILSQQCSYQAPVCTNFVYSKWADCNSSGLQSRAIVSVSPIDCVGGSPLLVQSCIPAGCSDGTPNNYCSVTPGQSYKYCENGVFVERCDICKFPCPASYSCQSNGSCVLLPADCTIEREILESKKLIYSTGSLILYPNWKEDGSVDFTNQIINPYFNNLYFIFLLDADPTQTQITKDWINWYFAHMNYPNGALFTGEDVSQTPGYRPELHAFGTIYNFRIGSDGKERPSFMHSDYYGEAYDKTNVSTFYYDSSDSYAATMLILLKKYYDATKDYQFIVDRYYFLNALLGAMYYTRDSKTRLTRALPTITTQFTMDNVEVWAGQQAFSDLLKQIVSDTGIETFQVYNGQANFSQNAKESQTTADEFKNSILQYLWDSSISRFRVSVQYDSSGKLTYTSADESVFYPGAAANLSPIMWNFPIDALAGAGKSAAIMASFKSHHPNFKELYVGTTKTPENYFGNSYASTSTFIPFARLNDPDAKTFLDNVCSNYIIEKKRPWYFIPADWSGYMYLKKLLGG